MDAPCDSWLHLWFILSALPVIYCDWHACQGGELALPTRASSLPDTKLNHIQAVCRKMRKWSIIVSKYSWNHQLRYNINVSKLFWGLFCAGFMLRQKKKLEKNGIRHADMECYPIMKSYTWSCTFILKHPLSTKLNVNVQQVVVYVLKRIKKHGWEVKKGFFCSVFFPFDYFHVPLKSLVLPSVNKPMD